MAAIKLAQHETRKGKAMSTLDSVPEASPRIRFRVVLLRYLDPVVRFVSNSAISPSNPWIIGAEVLAGRRPWGNTS
jgi:hypothetical protein